VSGRSHVLAERRGAGLWLTLDRPDKLNAVDPGMVEALHARLAEAASDEAVRAVVLTGAGRAFCAGADIGASPQDDAEAYRLRLAAFLERFGELTLAMERLPKPVIAAVNGTALAGGLELILACDLVFAAAEAKIGDGHARYGLMPGGGSTVRLPRRLAPAKASWLMFSGELVEATDPLLADLFTAVVPAAELLAEVERRVALVASRSPLVTARLKALAREAAEMPVEAGLAAEREVNGRHFFAADRAEGLAAFRERREPRFMGR
jgi:enoyl-CoA hydratase/carnithine racemase